MCGIRRLCLFLSFYVFKIAFRALFSALMSCLMSRIWIFGEENYGDLRVCASVWCAVAMLHHIYSLSEFNDDDVFNTFNKFILRTFLRLSLSLLLCGWMDTSVVSVLTVTVTVTVTVAVTVTVTVTLTLTVTVTVTVTVTWRSSYPSLRTPFSTGSDNLILRDRDCDHDRDYDRDRDRDRDRDYDSDHDCDCHGSLCMTLNKILMYHESCNDDEQFCLCVSIILCSPFLCHISITISSSYLLFLYTCIHHCLYHTFPFRELFLVTAFTF